MSFAKDESKEAKGEDKGIFFDREDCVDRCLTLCYLTGYDNPSTWYKKHGAIFSGIHGCIETYCHTNDNVKRPKECILGSIAD